uniref:THAP-type domain-containing protein n=1 Tax=Amblyomma aureolatum TaxID=187763 RepID=A0A1E1XDL6_9ACAR
MPTRCVAIGCTTTTHSVPRVSLHIFPRCAMQRKLWVLATKRDKWEPSKHSVLCSAHFRSEDFVHDPNVTATLQCAPLRRCLKPGAVPSLFSHSKKEGKPRAAFEKRRRLELVNSALAAAAAAESSSAVEKSGGTADKQCGTSDVEMSGISGGNKNLRRPTFCHMPRTASKFSQACLRTPAKSKGMMTTTTCLLRNCGIQTVKARF